MSVRRTQQSLQGLWNLTMDSIVPPNGRASPPPRDVEGGGIDGFCDPTTARRLSSGDRDRNGHDYDAFDGTDGLDAMQPPRLSGEGPLARVVLCFCLFLLLVVAVVCWNVVLQLSIVETARDALADVVQPPSRRERDALLAAAATAAPLTAGRSMKRMPALLRRFARVERAPPPQSGADVASLRLLFPHWFEEDEQVVARHVASDLALALSMLVQHEVAEEMDAPPPAPPPVGAAEL